MYGANTLCDGKCWWGSVWESATPGCPAEIDWWFPQCSQHIVNEVREGDRGNYVEEPRLFPFQDTT